MERTLYHGYSSNCCGYCKLHQCGITAKQMRNKECLKKQCWYLVKKEDHPYWRQRAAMKQKRINKKRGADQYVCDHQNMSAIQSVKEASA